MNKNRSLIIFILPIAMIGVAYAFVPLYQLFCQVTGYGGTTQVAEAKSDQILDQKIKVRFVASKNKDVPWQFTPEQDEIELFIGQDGLAYYKAKNLSNEDFTGIATYNVTPLRAGSYFNKIDCFCFEEQRLKAGQEVSLPVYFYIDPEIVNDPDLKGIEALTLSYSFFKNKTE